MNLRGYHIHVYCKPEEMQIAQGIREAMIKELPSVIEGAGPVRNRPVGPHALPIDLEMLKNLR